MAAELKGPFTLALTSVVMSAKSSLFGPFLFLPTATHSDIGHGHVNGITHNALFECGAVGRRK